ncbi:MAG: acyltransferase [Planctomycetota bacterium]|nr:acyltransferase [Planctomycetota bacterium]
MKSLATSESGKHFHWLDLFRFIAALTVVVTHTRSAAFVEYGSLAGTDKTLFVNAAYAVTRIANEAVILFFVLSGFLVGGRALERIVQGTFRPADYAIDRFVRIMLPLVPALALTALVRIIIDGGFSVLHLIGNLFSLQGIFVPVFGGNDPLWSLSYEVWFYIMAFAVGVAVIKKTFYLPAASILILSAAVFTSLCYVYLFCWLIGVLAYIRRPNSFSWKMLSLSVIVCLYSVASIQVVRDSISVSVEYYRWCFPSRGVAQLLLSGGLAIIIQQVLLLKPKNVVVRKLDSIGTILAASSYTLYLTHFPVLQFMAYFGLKRANEINLRTIAIFILSILICLLVSQGMYYLFEKHTSLVRRILKRWIAQVHSQKA